MNVKMNSLSILFAASVSLFTLHDASAYRYEANDNSNTDSSDSSVRSNGSDGIAEGSIDGSYGAQLDDSEACDRSHAGLSSAIKNRLSRQAIRGWSMAVVRNCG